MIAYKAVQKAIHGFSIATDMELLHKCISVLSYYAQKDAIAERFRILLNRQLEELRDLHASGDHSGDDAIADKIALHDVLFDFDSGSSKLHGSARELLDLIHRPFAGLSDIEPKATLSNRAEITMGMHLEWAWEFKNTNSFGRMVEPEAPSSASTGILEDTINPLLQSAGTAWSTWTPPVGS
jgi:hypothetical protein